jgi:hypothetical protein
MMKTVEINKYHPFVEDYDRRFRENVTLGEQMMMASDDHRKLVKEWYGYDIDIDYHGFTGRLTMTDEQYTLFVLRWA